MIKKALKSKKGISLMEILVGSMLFGLVVMTVASVISPMIMAFRRANDLAEYNLILDNVGNLLTSEMAQASDITGDLNTLVMTIETQPTIVSYSVQDGMLMRSLNIDDIIISESHVFPPGFYRSQSISFTINGSNSPKYIVEVTVRSQGRATIGGEISRDYAVNPIMIK